MNEIENEWTEISFFFIIIIIINFFIHSFDLFYFYLCFKKICACVNINNILIKEYWRGDFNCDFLILHILFYFQGMWTNLNKMDFKFNILVPN